MRIARSRRTAVAATAILALLGGSLAASPTALADDQATTDMRTDVRETDLDGGNQVRKRGDKLRDIVWAKASYADNKIKLWIEVRELGAENFAFGWRVRDADTTWIVQYDHEGEEPVLSLAIFGGGEAPCGSLTADRMPAMERLKVVLPASCIGHPEWIRFGAGSFHEIEPGRFRADDARLDNAMDPPHLKLGSRIHEN